MIFLSNIVIFFTLDAISTLAIEKLPSLDSEKRLTLTKECLFINLNSNFTAYPDKFFMILADEKLLPYIKCSQCSRFFYFYKLDPHGKLRNNSHSNVTNHSCIIPKAVPQSIAKFIKYPLSDELRDEISKDIATTLSL